MAALVKDAPGPGRRRRMAPEKVKARVDVTRPTPRRVIRTATAATIRRKIAHRRHASGAGL